MTHDHTKEVKEIFNRLGDIFKEGNEGIQKMIKTGYEALSLEHERENEIRIFCVFNNINTGSYRVTQGDAVIVDNIKTDCTFEEAMNAMIDKGKAQGENMTEKEIAI